MKRKLATLTILLAILVGTSIVSPSFAYGISIERNLTNRQIFPNTRYFYFQTYLAACERAEARIQKEVLKSEILYTANEFKYHGVVYYDGWKWTWYSQKVLPGGGLDISGRHVDDNNYICDEEGYICLASSSLSKGTVVDTPFGKKGKIYDCGCAANVLDVYTNF